MIIKFKKVEIILKKYFCVDVQWYSKDVLDYLKNFENLKKNIKDFNQDIINIYNSTCSANENNVMALTDVECIKNCILRTKANPQKFKNYGQFGH